jgi:dihydroorotate dehydrogenase electron transfer subunit
MMPLYQEKVQVISTASHAGVHLCGGTLRFWQPLRAGGNSPCHLPTAAGKMLSGRSASIKSLPRWLFFFAQTGAGTRWLAERRPEEEIDLLGPLGNEFSFCSDYRNILLLAGGIGIAPLCYAAEEAIRKGRRVRLLVGARTACQICPEQLLPEGCQVVAATEDGTAGHMGMITDLLPEHLPWADQVILCGPLPMYQAVVKKYSLALKNKPVQVSMETRMGCGLGICYSCTITRARG